VDEKSLPERKGKKIMPVPPLQWEEVHSSYNPVEVMRAMVPGGWMVVTIYKGVSSAIAFYPDPKYAWLRVSDLEIE